jgi:hypothetical protein
MGMQAGTTLWKKNWRLLKNLNIDLPYDLAIPLLGIYSKKYNTDYSRGTCTSMFIVVLFTIAKLWKNPLFFILAYTSAVNKNEESLFPEIIQS